MKREAFYLFFTGQKTLGLPVEPFSDTSFVDVNITTSAGKSCAATYLDVVLRQEDEANTLL